MFDAGVIYRVIINDKFLIFYVTCSIIFWRHVFTCIKPFPILVQTNKRIHISLIPSKSSGIGTYLFTQVFVKYLGFRLLKWKQWHPIIFFWVVAAGKKYIRHVTLFQLIYERTINMLTQSSFNQLDSWYHHRINKTSIRKMAFRFNLFEWICLQLVQFIQN